MLVHLLLSKLDGSPRAVAEALPRHIREGEVFTDHKALTVLLRRTTVSDRVLCWALQLQKYDLKIIYLKRAANRVADALSRGATPVADCGGGEEIPNELIVAVITEELEWTKELRQHRIMVG
ncbi:hypothetical protein Y032_0272g918 [Ancylostoma ceylanicum]|uniref:Reverse transcriptase RNase H-like domain-containing protein n=1 Tax=Ancylostoma ceylanicum TaxID=53326 RepID=A0A016S823_9BILA|nr:hypothetical protein Y032_0272g918 [Ancylostoma ceylanicum]